MSTFDSKARTFRHRNEINVLLQMTDTVEPINAIVYTSLGERASDLLNDSRAFIPVRLDGGETMIVAKTQIKSLVEQSAETEKPDLKGECFDKKHDAQPETKKQTLASYDPYILLRVARDANIEEIRSAYKARIKAVHPDALASLCLDEDIEKAAVLATQKVNYAYRKIMQERESKTIRMA
jgi:hypothetical protein